MVGNPEVICPGSGLVLGSLVLFLDNLRVADHPGPMDGSVESARQVESLQRIARFSSQC
jgi:hypothetical protein